MLRPYSNRNVRAVKHKRLVGYGVLAAAVALAAWRIVDQRAGERAVPAAETAKGTSVVLFADLREADEVPGCGELIQAVRAARSRGIPTIELDSSRQAPSRFNLRVAPTVVVLDSGKEIHRFEGEEKAVIAEVRSTLESLRSPK